MTTLPATPTSVRAQTQALSIPVSMEQHMENVGTSQAAQHFTYAMLSAPTSQLRNYAQVSDHGLGDYSSAGFIFDQPYAPSNP